MRNKKSAIILTVCVVSFGILFLGSFGRQVWTAFSQEGPAYYSVQMYASYQFNTLKHPTGLALMTDPYNGVSTLYIADSDNHVIRRFPPGGPLTTLGTLGSPGYVDGSTSTAKFNYPTGLTGNVQTCVTINPNNGQYYPFYQHFIYVDDAQNFVVRKFCVRGSVPPLSSPQGCSPCFNAVETACGSNVQGMVDGPSSSARFSALGGISIYGSSEYYIADAGNHSIREWDGSNVTTYAGNGNPGYVDGYKTNAQFYVPGKTAEDSAGNMYVADIENHAIRKIDTAGNVTTLAGAGPSQPGYVNGQGSAANFTRPTSVVFNSSDNMIYVADSHNNVIRRIDANGNVSTYAGTGTAGLVNGSLAQAQFSMPSDIAIGNGFMYISDTMNNVIRRIDMNTGIVSTYIS